MKKKTLQIALLTVMAIGCNNNKKTTKPETKTYSDVIVVGAMKNVMWKGELGPNINLDTIANKNGLYGLGPESYLTGELLIVDGESFVSKVTSDSTMSVEKRFDVSAPFFVYANVTEWEEIELPENIKTINDLEKFIDEKTVKDKRPFAFRLKGKVAKAKIHIQNLRKGAKVSSPEDAHQSQIKYDLIDQQSEIIGFFSTRHKTIFTHHDSFMHMHLITNERNKMGHLDNLEIGKMTLYLPKK